MRVHVYAANKVKESIVNHYVEENPYIASHDVFESTAQGNIISDSIQNTMQQVVDDEGDRDNLDELAKKEDERYAACQTSIQSSTQYIQWLSMSRFTDFTQQDNKDNAQYLKEQMDICSRHGLALYQAKQQFAALLKGDATPERSVINELLMVFLQSVVGQLIAQKDIFKCEVYLGDQFSSSVQQFFCSKFKDKKIKPESSAVRAIEWAFSIIKDNQINVPDDIDPMDVVAFENVMHSLDKQLNKRRVDYDNLYKLIAILEKVIAKLETVINPVTKPRTMTVSSRMIYPVKKR